VAFGRANRSDSLSAPAQNMNRIERGHNGFRRRTSAKVFLGASIDVARLPMTVFTDAKPQSDIFYLYAARGLRGFGDGFAIIILPVYLLAIGLSPQQVGIVAR
jgi:hypothetical protein